MNTHLTVIAAPDQAPGSVGGLVAGGSATVVGLILLALIINDWKKGMSKDTKKSVIMAMFMVVCLTGAGGVVGGLLSSAKTTAGTVGTTLTQTTTGQ